MNQNENINLIKNIFLKKVSEKDLDIRFIKIHGGNFQERGLPDLMILIKNRNNKISKQIWVEIKRDFQDTPSKLQTINIEALRKYGFITGYFFGDKFKSSWESRKEYSAEYTIDRIIKTLL